MLVSRLHGFALLRTRKTGGTSVEMALQPLCAPGRPVAERQRAIVTEAGVVGARLIGREEATALDREWPPHLPAAEMARRLPDWGALLKVTTVRDPFDRMVSAFHWEREVRALPPLAPEDEVATFRLFVASGWWEDDFDAVHVEGRFQPDMCLRHERLAADLAALARRLGVGPLSLPHAKPTRARRRVPLAECYDRASIRVVRDRLAWVFERFGYAPEPGAEPDGPRGALEGAA